MSGHLLELFEMKVRIREASSAEDRERVYRLRYRVYVHEMRRVQQFADHARGRIHEPFDETGHILVAECDDELVGTLRLNLRRDGPLEEEHLYDLERFEPFYPNQISMNTKLIVAPEFRSSAVAAPLAIASYRLLREHGMVLDFIDTNVHLVRLYQQLGYRFYKENISHPDYGTVTPMVLLLDDIDYLESVRSPFVPHARQFENGSGASEQFRTRFPEYAAVRPLFALSSEELWDRLSAALQGKPSETSPFSTDSTSPNAAKSLPISTS